MNKIKIIICDDHPFISEGLQGFLNRQENMELSASASHLEELFEILKNHKADILILDINLPDGNGIDACKTIKEQYPELKIIVLSNHDERSVILQMIQNGASSYILKSSSVEELSQAINEVYTNGFSFNLKTQEIISTFEKQSSKIPPVTKREKEVLQYLSEGLSTSEIAEKMFLSPQTVSTYRKSLLQKFSEHKTVSLLFKAKEIGLLQ